MMIGRVGKIYVHPNPGEIYLLTTMPNLRLAWEGYLSSEPIGLAQTYINTS